MIVTQQGKINGQKRINSNKIYLSMKKNLMEALELMLLDWIWAHLFMVHKSACHAVLGAYF